jgi:hypothetical protein
LRLHSLIKIIVLAACLQKTGGFACNWLQARAKFTSVFLILLPCDYVIHSTSAFSKSNIQGLSAEELEAYIEDVDLPMIKKYNYDVKTAFYTPLVCLSLVSWLPVACKLHLSGRQSHADCA